MTIKTALGLPLRPSTWGKAWEGLLASYPTIYIGVVLVAAFVAYAHLLRASFVFSCQADGYSSDRYLAYCGAIHYGDYEHGAYWFDLEPSVRIFARNADVLFLGDSRLQVAFSTAATANWFSTASARYHLLGFGYYENMIFAEELLRRIRPRARVYVINVEGFFDRSETQSMKTILHDPQARHRYEVKRLWQRVHEPICKTFAWFCRARFAIFRSRETGAWHTEGAFEQKITPVSYDQVSNQNVINNNTAAAIDFLSRLPVERRCIILAMVPTVDTKIGNGKAIATALGMDLVAPEIPEGLSTYDGAHLDQPSAQRWSQAFFQAAGSTIRSCLEEQGTASRRSTIH